MSNATRGDSGLFFLPKKIMYLSQWKLENISFAESKLSFRAPLRRKSRLSILLKAKYFKAAYGTFTLNWIRKRNVPLQIFQNRGGI